MKELSKDVVNTVMEFLILTFGKTTTLDVKSNLRKLGFSAAQNEVSEFMNDIFETWEDEYSYELDGEEVCLAYETVTENRKSFRVYTFAVPDVEEDYDADYGDDYCDCDGDCGDDECVCDCHGDDNAPTSLADVRQFISQNIGRSSALLAQDLGISVASVAAYKANINR